MTRSVGAAPDRFAAGHLGELTQQVPFEMVDEVLAETGAVQARVRNLPARVVVYLLLAGCLFTGIGYRQVWARLIAGLEGLPVPIPTASALTQARTRLGAGPLRRLFEVLAGPAATGRVPGTRWRGLLLCAIDGTLLSVPDSPANLGVYRKQAGGPCGGGSYPTLRLVTLLACGTRTVISAVFGPASTGETRYAPGLFAALRPGMLVLADRNFTAGGLITAINSTGAQVLFRARTGRGGPALPALARNPDGSFRSVFGGVAVRVIDARISVRTTAGSRTQTYRLLTTLLDTSRYPAAELIGLYHQRWEIETAYLELKSGLLGGRVLRARTPAGVEQEVWALLICYQAIRTAMTDATNSVPDLDPDRAGFTTALHAARDQVIHAAGVIADTTIDLVGAIGRAILADLLPDRRPRTNARTVKRAISKYNARGPHIDRRTYPTTVTIDVLTGTDKPDQPLTTRHWR
ncbi:IS4 family transposase [Cryptosporangium phraense]|uniref:IS4 family transposase n=1 Tax=Cryptosporangium phraense TaxID=2593070 RepID=A0A545AS21_9ACTN|nr:IS4 family transposase [Cryptosporangium phraense]